MCLTGFVWREAFPGDTRCVTPDVRDVAAQDNALGRSRRAAGGGPYGNDTCRSGFVWREAPPTDHVCVSPERRQQTALDNAAAAPRAARNKYGGSDVRAGCAMDGRTIRA